MITLEDCIGLCGASREAVEQVAHRDGVPPVLAAAKLYALGQAANETLPVDMAEVVVPRRLAA